MTTRLKDYRIYGKAPRERRFKAMDVSHMVQVTQISKATVFWAVTELKLERLRVQCRQMEQDNPGWLFELRERIHER